MAYCAWQLSSTHLCRLMLIWSKNVVVNVVIVQQSSGGHSTQHSMKLGGVWARSLPKDIVGRCLGFNKTTKKESLMCPIWWRAPQTFSLCSAAGISIIALHDPIIIDKLASCPATLYSEGSRIDVWSSSYRNIIQTILHDYNCRSRTWEYFFWRSWIGI